MRFLRAATLIARHGKETQDEEEIIQRVAALDIRKAELVCCVRVPSKKHNHVRQLEALGYKVTLEPAA